MEAMQLVKRQDIESPIQMADVENDRSDQTRASSKGNERALIKICHWLNKKMYIAKFQNIFVKPLS